MLFLLCPSCAGGGAGRLMMMLAWRDRNKNPVINANVLVRFGGTEKWASGH